MSTFRPLLLLIGLTLLGSSATELSAALPPLSPEELARESDVIAKGTVMRIRTREVSDEPDFVDTDFYIDLQITDVMKGRQEVGRKITVKTWQPKKRPEGFAGPQGQNRIPQKGDLVQVFCSGEISFQFRRQGGGRETALLLLEPNGLKVLPAVIPPEFVGRWEYVRQRLDEKHTTTLNLNADGSFEESHKVETAQTGKSSIAIGTAKKGKDRVLLDDKRTLMMLRDGRLLLEGGYELMLFVRVKKPDAAPGNRKPAPPKTGAAAKPDSQAQQFAEHIGVTIRELPNNELLVLTVKPGSAAAIKGIRPDYVLFEWTFQKSRNGSSWSTRMRPAE